MIYFLRYIKFLWQSDNAHGIHSPFVYNLATKCLLDFTDNPKYTVIDQAIAGNVSGLQQKQARLLFRILNYLQPDEVFYKGDNNTGLFNLISILIGSYNSQSRNSEYAAYPPLFWRGVGDEGCNPKFLTQNPERTNLYFININKKATALHYFRELLSKKNNTTTIIFHNIYATSEIHQVWSSIKNNPEVTVSVDIFYFGLVFFRQEQAKEHFTIRIVNSRPINALLGIRKLWGLID